MILAGAGLDLLPHSFETLPFVVHSRSPFLPLLVLAALSQSFFSMKNSGWLLTTCLSTRKTPPALGGREKELCRQDSR